MVGLQQGAVLNCGTQPCCFSKYCHCVRVKTHFIVVLLGNYMIASNGFVLSVNHYLETAVIPLMSACVRLSNDSFNTYLTLNI